MIRSGDGGVSLSVREDKPGFEESLKLAREWSHKNASNINASPPIVVEGSVIVQIK